MLRAVLIFTVIPAYMLLGSLVGYPLARLHGSPAVLYALGRFGCRLGLLLAGTRLEVSGREQLGDARNVVLMSNHASHLDAPALFLGLQVDFKAAAKKEIFRFPIFGQCLRLAGFAEVDRSDPEQSRRAMSQSVATLQAGHCFLVFPEGTRSPTGELGPFKKGGFVLALEAGSRIVPVVVQGARELMPKGRLQIRPGTVRVRLLDPIDARSYSYEQRDALIAEVRGRMARALGALGPEAGGATT
jgi:1-acyl-sn-glycerol-3-phosphate acyltransferase